MRAFTVVTGICVLASLEAGGAQATTIQRLAGASGDAVFSPDGVTLYVAGLDGSISGYDTKTNAITGRTSVGVTLGGIDITPDGKTIYAADRAVLGQYIDPTGNWPNNWTDTAVRGLNTTTGAVASYGFRVTGMDGPAFDVATTSNGKILASTTFYGSGWVPLRALDPATSTFSMVPTPDGFNQIRQNSALTRDGSGAKVLIGEANISDATLKLYDSVGGGITKTHEGYADGVSGFNEGVQAISTKNNLIVQVLYGTMNIYDASMTFERSLSAADIGFDFSDRYTGVGISDDGTEIYISDSNELVTLSTVTWTVTSRIPLGFTVGDYLDIANGLNHMIVDPAGRYLALTGQSLLLVDLDAGVAAAPEPASSYLFALMLASLVGAELGLQLRRSAGR